MNLQTPKKVSLIVLGIMMVVIGLTVYLAQQSQENRQQATDDVLPTPTSGVPACEVTQAVCRWDPLDNTTQYDVTIVDVETGDVISNGLINHPVTAFVFPAEPGKQYQCEVIARNSCGDGEVAIGEGAACPVPTVTPTEGPTETPGPTDPDTTPTDEPEITPTDEPEVTPTDEPEVTPTDEPEVTPTGVPTTTIPPGIGGGNTPTPTPLTVLPPTGLGDNIVGLTMIGSIIALIGTALVFFVW